MGKRFVILSMSITETASLFLNQGPPRMKPVADFFKAAPPPNCLSSNLIVHQTVRVRSRTVSYESCFTRIFPFSLPLFE